MKQGNLFSFFGKKPPASTVAAAASKKPGSTSNNKKSSSSSAAAPPKPLSTAVPTTKSPPIQAGSASKKAPPPSVVEIALGSRIEVYWADDSQWYVAEVSQRRAGASSSHYYLSYDDGTCEWLDLSTERFRQATGRVEKKQRRIIGDDDDDEGENELDMDLEDDEDEASEYKDDEPANNDGKTAAEVDAEEDDWMVTDDEDDAEISGRKRTSTSSATKGRPSINSSSAKNSNKKSTSSLQQFSAGKNSQKSQIQVTEHAGRKSSTSSSSSSPATPCIGSSQQHTPVARAKPRQITPTDSSTTTPGSSTIRPQSQSQPQWSPHNSNSNSNNAGQQQQQSTSQPPMPYVEGAVNPEGSHVHNHLPFLRPPKDARGRRCDDPAYDPRTLLVQEKDWQKIMGKKMTDAVKQWWDLKSQYFDTVLLFKTGTLRVPKQQKKCIDPFDNDSFHHSFLTNAFVCSLGCVAQIGKFYELFHMDADVGAQVLNLKYMKGHVAHSGFPESAYGTMADKLVRAGYKVARVEQTETPDMLKGRKASSSRGSAPPKVVNREVCSVMTIGTRTFCYLDDTSTIDSVGADHSPDIGPLLAIREIVLEPPLNDDTSTSQDDDQQQQQHPVCEYGITIVDAVRGSVTLGQFADDVLRSRMATLLTAFAPSEVRFTFVFPSVPLE
jgi:DNA mismatch repair protein MSH6